MLTLPLLRSTIRFPQDPVTTVMENLRCLQREMVPEGIDGAITSWLLEVLDRSGSLPDLSTVKSHYQTRVTLGLPDGPAALLRLAEVEVAQPTTPLFDPAAFLIDLDQYREQVMRDTTAHVLVESANILRVGVQRSVRQTDGSWKPVTIRGVGPALDHLQRGVSMLQGKLRRGATDGSFQEVMKQVVADYAKAAAAAGTTTGVFTGLDVIDNVHHGLRRGELALVLGFVSHMKTTFCLNWYYKAAVYFGKHVALVPLESPVEVMQKQLVCLHTTHPKFRLTPGEFYFSYDRVRDGVLTPVERKIFEEVADDLETCPEYGRMLFKQPRAEITVGDIFQWLRDETQRRGNALDLLVIDYLGLVDPEKGAAGLDKFANLNRAIRMTKLGAMDYENGRGLAVVSPFQANREGYKDAEKNGGIYTLRALSGANEAERSADYVYSCYLNDTMRRAHELAMGNQKSRNAPLITDNWRVFADPVTRIIDNLNLADTAQSPVEGGI